MKFLIFACVLLLNGIVLAQDFLPATEDVPLMDGLYQVEETATFDTPSEKMTIISALTHKTPQQIKSYYRQVLTNLGWTARKDTDYIRGSDTLTLEITQGSKTSIQFTLVQKN